MRKSPRLQPLLDDIAACKTMDELHGVMQRTAGAFDFSSYNFVDIGDPAVSTPYYIGTVEKAWETTYKDNKFADIDPCLTFARRTSIPFTWDKLVPDYKLGRKPVTVKLFEAARDFRYTDGFVVPYRFIDRFQRPGAALLSFTWSNPASKLAFMLSERRHTLHVLSLYWMEAAVEHLGRKASAAFLSRDAGLKGRQLLTDRERMALTWAGRGKTVSETADILGVASITVEAHLRSAYGKLNATNKTHAVVLAISSGWIEV